MKKYITITLAALAASFSTALAGPFLEQAELIRDNFPDTQEARSEYILDESVTSLVQQIMEYSGDDLTGKEGWVPYTWAYFEYLCDSDGKRLPVDQVDIQSAAPYLSKLPNGAWFIRLLTPLNEIDTLFGQEKHIGNVYWISKNREGVSPSLMDDYLASLQGLGVTHPLYQRHYRAQLAGMDNSAAQVSLRSEIRALLSQPESEDRDKWLVELRGQLLILQELAQ